MEDPCRSAHRRSVRLDLAVAHGCAPGLWVTGWRVMANCGSIVVAMNDAVSRLYLDEEDGEGAEAA